MSRAWRIEHGDHVVVGRYDGIPSLTAEAALQALAREAVRRIDEEREEGA